MRYLGRTSNYLEKITLYDRTHVMSIADHVAICVDTPMIHSKCSLEKEFIELIHMNHLMILYLKFNQVDSCYGCVHGPWT